MVRPRLQVKKLLVPAAVFLLAGHEPAFAQNGFLLRGDRIDISGATQWRAWDIPFGTATVDAAGVKPNFVRSVHNACLDAGEYPLGEDEEKGGISGAGSNVRQASGMIDGRADTFWEPDLSLPPETWWVEVDLGRAVSARRVALRFVDEELGDPFLQFKVLVSTGETIALSKQILFREVGRTERPNRRQREFSFDISPGEKADPGFAGDVIRFVQVVVTDSRLGKAEEISRAEYEALPTAQQGDIEYFGRSRTGREWQLEKGAWELLGAEEQGPLRYYRRERPRLAELEVWTFGENTALATFERGGSVVGPRTNESRTVDGNFLSTYEVVDAVGRALPDPRERILIDLGSFYWLNRIRILFGNFGRKVVLSTYRLMVSDGSLAPDGTLLWRQLYERRNREAGSGVWDSGPRALLWNEARFSPSKARFVQFEFDIREIPRRGHGREVPIREIQSFGVGYQPEVEIESPLIDLGKSKNLTTIQWEADEPPGTRVEISTRTGNETEALQRFFRKDGSELTESEYKALPKSFRGEIRERLVPGADWSEWSRPVKNSGDRVVSPSPRRLMKVRARLMSDDPDLSATLQRLSIRFTSPWVERALGEVYPTQLDELGKASPLTLYLRPERGRSGAGIDEILVVSASDVPLSLEALRLGPAADIAGGGGDVQEELEVIPTGPDSLWVRLPGVVRRNDVVAVDMSTVIYGHGTALSSSVGNTSSPGSWQRVDPDQEALEEIRSGVMQVLTPPGRPMVGGLQLSSPVVTPNGDGANDEMQLNFSVLRVEGPRQVAAEVFDLSGRRLWSDVRRRPRASGAYRVKWEGVDAAGTRLAPGAYLLRVSVDAGEDSGGATETLRAVYVAY